MKHIRTGRRVITATTALAILPVLLLFPSVFAQTSATFSGTGSTHLVAKIVSTGQVVNLDIPTDFSVSATPGGPGVGTLALTITLSLSTPVTMAADGGANDPVGRGLITITSNSATGGGTLFNPTTGYESQFGFGVTSSGGSVSGQFQCQNTGRSASVVDAAVSMLLGTTADVLQMTVHGTVSSFAT